MVSVIVPVYNVEKYLDKCLKTVVNQTYGDLEILLINDGSTDNSGAICKVWAASDDRIQYIEKQNEGLGPTRNLGLHLAKGEYVLFIDSDDWWEYDAVEKLNAMACKYDADIVYMNFYYSEYKDGVLNERPYIRHYTMDGAVDAKQFPKIIFDEDARMWSKMFRRSLFIKNNIYMPAHPYEDLPVMPLLAIYARRVCQTNEALYHYYYERPNNIISNSANKRYVFTGIQELYEAFKTRGLLDQYGKQLMEYCIGMAKFALNEMKGDKQEYIAAIQNIYPDYPYHLDLRFLIWGSYNSLLIARNVSFLNTQILEHYMFSSIISAMSENDGDMEAVPHENPFRQDMIRKDIQKKFFKNDLMTADYMLIDFLEEINDVLKIEDSFYTNSEAHQQINIFDSIKYESLSILNEKRTELWERKCLDFTRRIKQYFKPCQVILLRQKLCTLYGPKPEELKSFDNIEKIEKINSILEGYYAFFEKNFPGIMVIDMEVDGATYTYEFTKYGCLPQFYNGLQYKAIAQRISAAIEKT